MLCGAVLVVGFRQNYKDSLGTELGFQIQAIYNMYSIYQLICTIKKKLSEKGDYMQSAQTALPGSLSGWTKRTARMYAFFTYRTAQEEE